MQFDCYFLIKVLIKFYTHENQSNSYSFCKNLKKYIKNFISNYTSSLRTKTPGAIGKLIVDNDSLN